MAPSCQKYQLQQPQKHGENRSQLGQVTTRGHRELQGTLTANVRPQLVVIVLQQCVKDLCGISFLCLGGEDPGFIDAEVIIIVFLCALAPGAERQKERDIAVASIWHSVGAGAQLGFRDTKGGGCSAAKRQNIRSSGISSQPRC